MSGVLAFSVLLGVAAMALAAEECKVNKVPVPPLSQASIPRMQFDALHAAIAPEGAGEGWGEIPWQTNLLAARKKAAELRKPLFLWVMDGHPLGCT